MPAKSAKTRGRRSGKSGRRFLLPLLLLALAGALAYLLLRKSTPNPSALGQETDPRTGEVIFEVPRKAALASVGADLEAKGLITDRHLFVWLLRLTRLDKRIKAGYFYVHPSNSVLGMALTLTRGKMATRTVTIPEGKTSWEIFSLLRAQLPLDSARFDSLVRSPDFARLCAVPGPGLEGYLFPDTYRLPWRITERDALRIMVGRFREVTRDMDTASAVYRAYGRNGWVTLASIVEKEAAVQSEQELIAGVFYNRLRQGWSLGADPTVRFALRKLTGPLDGGDLDVNSPYNTRKFAGLPPGPICNPGRTALKAALAPHPTPMMYFVAKDDGSREHYFSPDNAQHMRYKGQAAKNRKRMAGK